MKGNLYAIGCMAIKSSLGLVTHYSVKVSSCRAANNEEAKAKALLLGMQACPQKEGWDYFPSYELIKE